MKDITDEGKTVRNDEADLPTPDSSRALSRRTLLGAGGIAAGGLVLGGGLPGVARATQAAASKGDIRAAGGGKIIWVPPLLADFNVPIDLGFRDFADAYGWKYQKINTGTALDPTKIINGARTAIQAKPQVLVLYAGIEGLANVVKEANSAGIKVLANNTIVPDVAALNVPYIGQEFVSAGTTLGLVMGDELFKRGKKSGVVIDSNPAPGNLATEQRHQGFVIGLKQFNAKNKTQYVAQQFYDSSYTPPKSLTLYSAKFKQLGSQLIGIGSTGVVPGEVILDAVKQAGFKPGQIPIVSHDTSPKLDAAVKDGWIQALMDQQLYSQGFIAAAEGWQWVARDFIPAPTFDTGELVITKANIDAVAARDDAVTARAKKLGIA
jgi:simple sugar transport system substrate-binding protein